MQIHARWFVPVVNLPTCERWSRSACRPRTVRSSLWRQLAGLFKRAAEEGSVIFGGAPGGCGWLGRAVTIYFCGVAELVGLPSYPAVQRRSIGACEIRVLILLVSIPHQAEG